MKTVKKLFAFLLILCMFLSLSVTAFAVSAEYATTRSFLKVLDREKNKYTVIGLNDEKQEQVNVSVRGDNKKEINVSIFFNEDQDVVSMRSWYVISFDKADLGKVLETVNQLNNDYKFVRFTVDLSDYSVDAKIDCPLREDDCAGEIGYDALYYIENIVDEGYLELKEFEK